MTKRYLGNIVTQNPTAPAGNFEGSAAKGVWSLEEQLAYQKAGLWPTAGNAPLDITDVFSTYLYDGTGSTQTITNGIDLAGEGGIVWTKSRSDTGDHNLFFENGSNIDLVKPNKADSASLNMGQYGVSFNSNGFSMAGLFAPDTVDIASWTFRKAPKFFTCLTYTGTGSAQSISHDLGSAPGMVIVKRTDASDSWRVYHRASNASSPQNYYLNLDETAAASAASSIWNNTAPTDTTFTVGTSPSVNGSGSTYVAYLFAHNDGDGGFGPDADQDIIKCGSYTGNGSSNGPEIDLGFEPQWMLTKRTDGGAFWNLVDVSRGWTADGDWKFLRADGADAEADGSSNTYALNSTGFKVTSTSSSYNASGGTYIYMAIRRGPLAAPTAGTEVFAIDRNDGTAPSYESGFPVDMGLIKRVDDTNSWLLADRLRGTSFLSTDSTNSEASNSTMVFDYMEGWNNWGSSQAFYSWMWKRATGCFDAVCYTGDGTGSSGSGRAVSHNLGVAPEMMWVKQRDVSGEDWWVYHSGLDATAPEDYNLILNATNAKSGVTGAWARTAPNDTAFFLDQSPVNVSNGDFIAYLFASLDGISKVGSYTGTGNSGGDINVDCGFTSGARFVLIKRTDASGGWWVADTVRGIVTGNEPLLALNDTGAEVTGFNMVKPYSAGFIVNGSGGGDNAWNDAGGTYIFYAIA